MSGLHFNLPRSHPHITTTPAFHQTPWIWILQSSWSLLINSSYTELGRLTLPYTSSSLILYTGRLYSGSRTHPELGLLTWHWIINLHIGYLCLGNRTDTELGRLIWHWIINLQTGHLCSNNRTDIELGRLCKI